MKSFILGLVSGLVILAIIIGIGYSGTIKSQTPKIINCSTYIGSSHMGIETQCLYRDEVMVGIKNGVAYCARVYVNCYDK